MIKLPGVLLSLLLSCLLALFLLADESAQSVGIIGGADGPTAIVLSDTVSSASVIGGADDPTDIYINNDALSDEP